MRKVPEDAFHAYVALGVGRSYQALADKLGVHKRTIVRRAKKEDWTGRLERIQAEAREATDRRIAETYEEMTDRHVKLLKAMGARVVGALKEFPLTTGMEALRGAELVIKLERLVAGEPSDRTSLSIEEITKHEMHTLLRPVEDDGDAA